MTFLPDQWLPDSHVLAGKTILITGAGDGIGKAAALTFARHGAEVLLLGRTEAKQVYSNKTNTKTLDLNISNFKNGYYSIQIKVGEFIKVKSFIKN